MEPVTKKQSTGAALVFVLMALIALLALAVVFLSRTGRDVPEPDAPALAEPELVTTSTEEAGPMMIPQEPETTETAPAEEPPAMPAVPPPPPPVSTPDSRNLPPEG